MSMKFHVVLEAQPEGGFTATCVEIPGAISEGDTEQEALVNIADAIKTVLDHRRREAESSLRRHHGVLQTVDVDAEAPS